MTADYWPLSAFVTDEFPTLKRATANSVPAVSMKVEWHAQKGDYRVSWWNWAQIMRTPYSVSGASLASRMYDIKDVAEDAKQKALQRHLASLEANLLHGCLATRLAYHVDSRTGDLYAVEQRTMGGAMFYLGREPKDSDELILRPLRELRHVDLTPPDLDGYKGEWLSEIALQVNPG